MLKNLESWDVSAFYFINQKLHHPFLDLLMKILSSNYFWIFTSLALLGFSMFKNLQVTKKYLLVFSISMILTDTISFRILKPLFSRKRPCHQLDHVLLVADSCGSLNGFPSNHAANGMGLATTAFLVSKNPLSLVMFPIAFIVGYTRIYLGVHFPADIFFGFLLGALSGVFIWFTMPRLQNLYRLKFPTQIK